MAPKCIHVCAALLLLVQTARGRLLGATNLKKNHSRTNVHARTGSPHSHHGPGSHGKAKPGSEGHWKAVKGGGADTRIINGEIADPGEYPYYVYLDNSETLCGGTLIAPRVVLTAGAFK
jgi:Trypsin